MVLDSQQLELEPRAHKEVFLRLCPLLLGTVAISGLKWRLSESVWGHHEFNLPGKLLQDTREHKAQRARATNEVS